LATGAIRPVGMFLWPRGGLALLQCLAVPLAITRARQDHRSA